KGCVEARSQPRLGEIHAAGDRLHEAPRIVDAVGDERVHLVELAARHLDANVVDIEAQDTILDEAHIVCFEEGEWQLEIDAWSILTGDDLPEARDDRLLALVDDVDRGIGEEKDYGREDCYEGETVGHQLLPPCGSCS